MSRAGLQGLGVVWLFVLLLMACWAGVLAFAPQPVPEVSKYQLTSIPTPAVCKTRDIMLRSAFPHPTPIGLTWLCLDGQEGDNP